MNIAEHGFHGRTVYGNQSSVNPCPGKSSSVCTNCGGDGLVEGPVNCKHGRGSSHSYCSHDKVSLHDN